MSVMERGCVYCEVRLPLYAVCGVMSLCRKVALARRWFAGHREDQRAVSITCQYSTQLSHVYKHDVISRYTSITVCVDLTSYNLVDSYERFGVTCYVRLQGRRQV